MRALKSFSTLMAALAVCVAALTAQPAAVSAGEQPLSIQGLDDHERKLFMAGMAQGIIYLATMQRNGREYCLPAGGGISGEFLWRLASRRLTRPRRVETIAPVVTALLAAEFPCPKTRVEAVAIN